MMKKSGMMIKITRYSSSKLPAAMRALIVLLGTRCLLSSLRFVRGLVSWFCSQFSIDARSELSYQHNTEMASECVNV